MVSWTHRVYNAAAWAAAPWMRRRLAARVANDPLLQARQRERDGDVAGSDGELWLHAASMGEVAAAIPLAEALLNRDARCRMLFTTMTETGARQVLDHFAGEPRLRHAFAPLDTPARVRRWLDAVRPSGLLLAETELWPELLRQCQSRRIPVSLVSARLSAGAFGRYLRFRSLFLPGLSVIDPVLCQDSISKERFEALGVDPDRLQVTGNLKRARQRPAPIALDHWERALISSRTVWLAGSAHPDEADVLVAAHRRLLKQVPDALLVLVPRHPDRAEAFREVICGAGSHLAGENDVRPEQADVLMLARTGLLAGLYGEVPVALVGGSLTPGPGGHNLFEPAAAGCAVLSGPHLDNQQEASALLLAHDALTLCADGDGIASTLAELLKHPDRAQALGERARQAVHGAGEEILVRTMDALSHWPGLPRATGEHP